MRKRQGLNTLGHWHITRHGWEHKAKSTRCPSSAAAPPRAAGAPCIIFTPAPQRGSDSLCPPLSGIVKGIIYPNNIIFQHMIILLTHQFAQSPRYPSGCNVQRPSSYLFPTKLDEWISSPFIKEHLIMLSESLPVVLELLSSDDHKWIIYTYTLYTVYIYLF